jgi:hypothetical protein
VNYSSLGFPPISVRIENPITQRFKNLLELEVSVVVGEVFAQNVLNIHGITGDHEVEASKPRSFENECAIIFLKKISRKLVGSRCIE